MSGATLKQHVEFFLGFVAVYAGTVAIGTLGAYALGIPAAVGALFGQLCFLGLFVVWAAPRVRRAVRR